MPIITAINGQKSNPDRVNVFIDYQFCCGIRTRTFQAMNLKVGDEITCEELKERENFFWKKSYGEESWRKEKVRIERVRELIRGIDDNAVVNIVGFGADSEQLIAEHPEEKGKPDIDVAHRNQPENVLIKIEVTGTERKRGTDSWVRPDKIEYAENHPDEDVWIILHFAEPEESFTFIKPERGRTYNRETKEIRGAGEIFCCFNDWDDEVKTYEIFSEHLKERLGEVK